MAGFVAGVVLPWLACVSVLVWFAWDLRGH
jgi:hypothetical protein